MSADLRAASMAAQAPLLMSNRPDISCDRSDVVVRQKVQPIGSASRSSSKLGSKGSPWTRSSHYLPRLPLRLAAAMVTRSSSDGVVAADLSVPKEMGGAGKPGTATPEHLFAAGYAACFGGALDLVGKQHKQDASRASVLSPSARRPVASASRSSTAAPRQVLSATRTRGARRGGPRRYRLICTRRGNVDVTFEVVGG